MRGKNAKFRNKCAPSARYKCSARLSSAPHERHALPIRAQSDVFGAGVFVCARCDSLVFNCGRVSVVLRFAVILNPTDFDFLLSKGTGAQQINPRDSILERFDPILGRPSVVADFAPKALPVIATIPEADSSVNDSTAGEIDVSLVATEAKSTPAAASKRAEVRPVEAVKPTQAIERIRVEPAVAQPVQSSPVQPQPSEVKSVAVKLAGVQPVLSKSFEIGPLAGAKVDESAVKLDSSDILDRNRLGDSGEHSQASSTTETYETASTGEPFKVRLLLFRTVFDSIICAHFDATFFPPVYVRVRRLMSQ